MVSAWAIAGIRLATTCLLLQGCGLARLDAQPTRHDARILIPRAADGRTAVRIYSIDTLHHFMTQRMSGDRLDKDAYTLSPGRYWIEIECEREGASVVIHGGIDYRVVLRGGMDYRLDCAPVHENGNPVAENHFSFVEEARMATD